MDINSRDTTYKGWSYLMFAIYYDRLDIALILLKKGIDVNARNDVGETAIMLAKSEEMFNLLVDHGADLNLYTYRRKTLLMYMIDNKLISSAINLLRNRTDINFQFDLLNFLIFL